MSAAVRALREAIDADRSRQMWELYESIVRTYGVNAGNRFKAWLWWGWDYTMPKKHLPFCRCALHGTPEATK